MTKPECNIISRRRNRLSFLNGLQPKLIMQSDFYISNENVPTYGMNDVWWMVMRMKTNEK